MTGLEMFEIITASGLGFDRETGSWYARRNSAVYAGQSREGGIVNEWTGEVEFPQFGDLSDLNPFIIAGTVRGMDLVESMEFWSSLSEPAQNRIWGGAIAATSITGIVLTGRSVKTGTVSVSDAGNILTGIKFAGLGLAQAGSGQSILNRDVLEGWAIPPFASAVRELSDIRRRQR